MNLNLNRGISTPLSITIIVVIGALAIGGILAYDYYQKDERQIMIHPEDVEIIDETADWKTYTNEEYGFEFQYPSVLSLNIQNETVILKHSVAYRHPDPCDFKGDSLPLDRLIDFNVSFKIFNKNLKEMIQSSEYPGWDYVSKNPFKLGSLNGFKVMEGIEGCGKYAYYFNISPTKTLVIDRSIITEFVAPIGDKQTYLNVSGVILPDQEENYFNQIVSTFKFIKDELSVLKQEGFVDWTCGDTLTDTRDSKEYDTVLIGSQCWMAEHINVGTMTAGINEQGTDCPTATEIEKYCYSDTEGNCTTDGALYQWAQTMCGAASCNRTGAPPNDACAAPVQGICPDGWHIPSHYEWTTLELEVCDSASCATDFPYDDTTTGWRGIDEGTQLKVGGSSEFEAILAGCRNANGSFYGRGAGARLWSSLGGDAYAWGRRLGSGNASVGRYAYYKLLGFSVRCLKD